LEKKNEGQRGTVRHRSEDIEKKRDWRRGVATKKKRKKKKLKNYPKEATGHFVGEAKDRERGEKGGVLRKRMRGNPNVRFRIKVLKRKKLVYQWTPNELEGGTR